MISLRTTAILLGAGCALSLAAAGCTASHNLGGGTPKRSDLPPAVPLAPEALAVDAVLRTAAGAEVGRATALETAGGGVQVRVEAHGLPPGTHGVHVHTTGKCDAPDFASAGAHWNPGARQHGSANPMGPHAGDMPNLSVGPDGTGHLDFVLPGGTLDAVMDPDGSALVVHAGEDDLRTDPSGNSGGRIACGVFVAED